MSKNKIGKKAHANVRIPGGVIAYVFNGIIKKASGNMTTLQDNETGEQCQVNDEDVEIIDDDK